MNVKRAIAISIALSVTLAACGRESTPAADQAAPGPGASSAPDEATISKQADLQSTAGNYTEALERVHKATNGLRESIQALAQRPPGPQRTVAIAMAHQALSVTNQAMAQLPPEMRADAVGAPSPASGPGTASVTGSQPDSPEAVQALQRASDALRAAVQQMIDEPEGERRNQATRAAHQALADTNRAMIALPPKAQAGK